MFRKKRIAFLHGTMLLLSFFRNCPFSAASIALGRLAYPEVIVKKEYVEQHIFRQ